MTDNDGKRPFGGQYADRIPEGVKEIIRDMAKTERARDRVDVLEAALKAIIEIFSDRERFVMEGPRAFLQVERIAREALKGRGEDD